jgi:hypothetical protein
MTVVGQFINLGRSNDSVTDADDVLSSELIISRFHMDYIQLRGFSYKVL